MVRFVICSFSVLIDPFMISDSTLSMSESINRAGVIHGAIRSDNVLIGEAVAKRGSTTSDESRRLKLRKCIV